MSLNIKVKHSPSHDYGNDCFWIPSTSVSGWDTVMEWMQENGVEYTLNYVIEVAMLVEIEKLGRRSLKEAKTEFSETYPDPTPMLYGSDRRRRYWEDFGKANNLEVIITEWHHGYPVIGALEFNDEQSYIWFMLRWI